MSIEAIKGALGGVTPDRLRYEADVMYAAVQGEEYGDTFHAFNWADKPHRVLYDAINLIRDSASEIDRLQRENALMQERTADYPTISAKLHDREKAREAEQRDCREAIARAEAAEAEVARLQTELALSKPLYSRRQIEARVKLLEAALKPFAEEAENWSDSVPDDHKTLCTEPGSSTAHPGSEAYFTVGDLRRARDTLASTGGEHQ